MSRWAAHVKIDPVALREVGLPLVRAVRAQLVSAADREGSLDPSTYRFAIEVREDFAYRETDYVAHLTARTMPEVDRFEALALPVWPPTW